MSEKKHTPGPWKIKQPERFECDAYIGAEGNGGYRIANCFGPDTEANARLIAIAPELLDALIHLEHNARKSGADMGLALDVARAAITKAQGGIPMSYYDRIMNIPAKPPKAIGSNHPIIYKEGHRDARHAAAEIAGEADAEIARLKNEKAELLEALENMVSIALPGMNWTDEIGQKILQDAHAIIAKVKGK